MKKQRTHPKHWKDATRTARGNKRTAQLNELAKAMGWKGISEYLTAIIRGEKNIPQK